MTEFDKTLFHLPAGQVYLDGNSLGPLPRAAVERVASMMREEWGEMLVGGWNTAGWMEMSTTLGDRIGRLIGASPGSVILGDTLSIKVYQALASALELNRERKVILSDEGNFPSDLYMARGLIEFLGRDYELRLCSSTDVAAHLSEDVAVLMLTEVDYKTGWRHDMRALTEKAQAHGILTVWDLAHSAGAIPVDLAAAKVDFAVGCTYKYLNSGPGGTAFIYVAPRLQESIRPALPGWLGHLQPFAFDLDYRPANGIERMRIGTPPILQMTALAASLDIWDQVDMHDIRVKSIELSELFIELIEASCADLELASPRNAEQRGSQVSFRFEQGYAAMQALIDRGVIGDFRAPDIMRFGITPLYIDEADIRQAAAVIAEVMNERLWDRAEYYARAAVT